MRLVIDTSRYVDFSRGAPGVAQVLEAAESIFIPFAVLGELRGGFAAGSRGPANERQLRRFLLRGGVEPLFPDDQTTHHYASLYRQLRHQGTPVPINDLWIAALVIQHDLVLYARDQHFDHLPQLVRI